MQRLKKGTAPGHFRAQKKLKKKHRPFKNTFYIFFDFLERVLNIKNVFFGIQTVLFSILNCHFEYLERVNQFK
jgi:hypothetical protein